MDFHVWAKLDFDGRIQSVQSSCIQSPQTESPGCPGSDVDLNVGESPKGRKKLVPYAEKKELIYKLDAKVDEMAVMMTQLAELSKRVKVQEKLLKQYEDKIFRQQIRISALEAENNMLRSKPKEIRRVKSFDNASLCTTTLVKKLNSLDTGAHRSLDEHEDTLKKSSSETCLSTKGRADLPATELDDVDGPVDNSGRPGSAVRPSALSIDFDISSTIAGPSIDFATHFNINQSDIVVKNGYSYARKRANLAEKNSDVKHQNLHDYSRSSGLQGCIYDSGYLKMNSYSPQFDLDLDDTLDNQRREISRIKMDDTNQVEAIHGSWTNERIIYHKSNTDLDSPSDKYLPDLSDSGYMCPQAHEPRDYMAIRENSPPGEAPRPPLPLPRKRSSDSFSSVTSSELRDYDRQSCYTSCLSKNSDQSPSNEFVDFRRPSLPASAIESDSSPREKTRSLVQTRNTRSFDKVSPVRTPPAHETVFGSPPSSRHIPPFPERHVGAELRKDDRLNKLLQDMRTTMEWNEAKKNMILSEAKTMEEAEQKFRTFVQDMYEAFCSLHKEKGRRLQKLSKEKMLAYVSDKMGVPLARELVSEEFMRKCLDFLLMTCK